VHLMFFIASSDDTMGGHVSCCSLTTVVVNTVATGSVDQLLQE